MTARPARSSGSRRRRRASIAAHHVVEQLEAVSRDGTRIPYFLIRPRAMRYDGSTPTLLYGYGGFQVSELPAYSGTMGRLWLEQGNAYVVANLRGGGEFGPEWHQSAQGANKQRTWDDYVAVAEDLIRRRITSPRRLGAVGGSQGGLLVGTAITQHPELFHAAIIQVPLFDMLRYHLMGAGASWIGEYGDPRIPEQRAWIEAYSPYQHLAAGRDLSDAAHRDLDRRRPRPSRPRPQGGGAARGSSASLIIITRISKAATPPRRTSRKRRGGSRWNIPTRRGGWWTEHRDSPLVRRRWLSLSFSLRDSPLTGRRRDRPGRRRSSRAALSASELVTG